MSCPKTYPEPAPPPREFIFPLRHGFSLTVFGAEEGDNVMLWLDHTPSRLRIGPLFVEAEIAETLGKEIEWQGRSANGTLPQPERYDGVYEEVGDEDAVPWAYAEPIGALELGGKKYKSQAHALLESLNERR